MKKILFEIFTLAVLAYLTAISCLAQENKSLKIEKESHHPKGELVHTGPRTKYAGMTEEEFIEQGFRVYRDENGKVTYSRGLGFYDPVTDTISQGCNFTFK